MLSSVIALIFLPGLAYSFQCYRCFGNSFCNGGANHSAFLNSTHIDKCEEVITTAYNGTSPEIQDALRKVNQNLFYNGENPAAYYNNSNNNTNVTDSRFGCMTATIFEGRENHTLRMCVANATIYCQALASVLFPTNTGESYAGIGFSCNTCTTALCNRIDLTGSYTGSAKTSVVVPIILVVGLLVHLISV